MFTALIEKLNAFHGLLDGKKTYIGGVVTILYGVTGFLLGTLDTNSAVGFVMAGAITITMRSGLNTAVEQALEKLLISPPVDPPKQ